MGKVQEKRDKSQPPKSDRKGRGSPGAPCPVLAINWQGMVGKNMELGQHIIKDASGGLVVPLAKAENLGRGMGGGVSGAH